MQAVKTRKKFQVQGKDYHETEKYVLPEFKISKIP